MYYSIYNSVINEIRTDFAYYVDKLELQHEFETYYQVTRGTTKAEQLWGEDGYAIIETPLDFINEAESETIRHFLQGKPSDVVRGSFDELEAITDWQSDIKYIIEVQDFGFATAWYIVVSEHRSPFTIGYERHDGMALWSMNHQYRKYLNSKIFKMSYRTLYNINAL